VVDITEKSLNETIELIQTYGPRNGAWIVYEDDKDVYAGYDMNEALQAFREAFYRKPKRLRILNKFTPFVDGTPTL
jgi:hypothetical protein